MIQFDRVKDPFELPEHLSKSAFVLKLTEGAEDPQTTASTYVVTAAGPGSAAPSRSTS
jgi:hypothetical protein